MDRRAFLKIAGMGSVAFAAGCSAKPEKTLYSLVQAPDDMITGKATWYAGTCRECPAGCGTLAKQREGRVIKLEGNPLHPVNRGNLCMRGQAALQAVYNPDRLLRPRLKTDAGWKEIGFTEAEQLLGRKVAAAKNRGRSGTRLLSEVVGAPMRALLAEVAREWGVTEPVYFEPFAHEALRAAHQTVLGTDTLPTYRLEQADLLISFGADFLETWLSPVEYARRFKEMHAVHEGHKGRFLHLSPYQSLTAANADRWHCIHPGSEMVLIKGLIQHCLAQNRGSDLPRKVRAGIAEAVAGTDLDAAAAATGISTDRLNALADRLVKAERPLVLGGGSGTAGTASDETELAALLLNLVLDPQLGRIDFSLRQNLGFASPRPLVSALVEDISADKTGLLLIHNCNPVYALPQGAEMARALDEGNCYTVCFTNFMDDTAAHADLVFPIQMALETWDAYDGKAGQISLMQPAMGRRHQVPAFGDVILKTAVGGTSTGDYQTWLLDWLGKTGMVTDMQAWIGAVQAGGLFDHTAPKRKAVDIHRGIFSALNALAKMDASNPAPTDKIILAAAPSIRFFDGRGANRPWLCEIPDPLTKVAWQAPVVLHPEAMNRLGVVQGDLVRLHSDTADIEAPVYAGEAQHPGLALMAMGQGHQAYGRYAQGRGGNPVFLLGGDNCASGQPLSLTPLKAIAATGRRIKIAHTDGSRTQYGRKIAVSQAAADDESHGHGGSHEPGLTMDSFPLTLPLPEAYDSKRDIYPPHEHVDYRWGMVVDLDRCIGCGACAAACYAENNLGVVGEKRIIEGREMAWLRIERYLDPNDPTRITFFPLMCQHCDNAPCESVCPVYAPHHSKEGLNNQIYNRCIGTRFCAQNCPYKARRFNWFDWQWPSPLDEQLNPNVTVRSKGVMEKCSFCIQRIKVAHGHAKDENRRIRDGEIQPACVQTCPTGALVFGDLSDRKSRVRQLTGDPRAYQAMGYLNTKPAVIYLKKVVQEI
jgi:molybdopterin-containing oxidoreductase family iron-sulfur binding subunit